MAPRFCILPDVYKIDCGPCYTTEGNTNLNLYVAGVILA